MKDPQLRQKVAEAGATAAGAFEDFADVPGIEQSEGRRRLRDRRGALHRAAAREGAASVRRARAPRAGREQYDLLANEANKIARQIDGGGDWTAVCEKLNRVHAPTPDAMRAEYEEWTDRARSFLVDTGLVTLAAGRALHGGAVAALPATDPGGRELQPASRVQRFAPRALLRALPAGRDTAGGGTEAARGQLQRRDPDDRGARGLSRATTGTWSWRSRIASPIRRTHFTSYFAEGWGLYAERVMREQGFFTDPRHLLFQYEATLFRAARIVVDTSLHMKEMTFDAAVDFMVKNANLTPPNAKAEVGRYCSWPTQASSYLTGMLEIIDIRTRWLAQRGSADRAALRAFHDAITSTGSIPTSLAERAIAN